MGPQTDRYKRRSKKVGPTLRGTHFLRFRTGGIRAVSRYRTDHDPCSPPGLGAVPLAWVIFDSQYCMTGILAWLAPGDFI
jgi:hypothetical protein